MMPPLYATILPTNGRCNSFKTACERRVRPAIVARDAARCPLL